ncbi:MAG: sarcosine oxidase subunit gamma [Pseudolabrys sp.]
MSDLQFYASTPQPAERVTGGLDRSHGSAGVTVRQPAGLSLTLVTARNGTRQDCIGRLRAVFDVEAPAAAKASQGVGLSLVWAGPESWLAVASGRPTLESELKAALGDAASIVDVSDARLMLRISGPKARAALAKGLSIDLHPRVFVTGDTAMTLLAHVPVQLWQVDETPTFDLAVPRATARDVFHWLIVSAEEFGVEIISESKS